MTPDPAGLILASASPRRREILSQLGLPFTVVVAGIVEDETPDADPRRLVGHNAALKAAWVSARFPAATVLGADTTVCLDGQVLNKPADAAAARAMLRRLSGRTHTVHTGLALRRGRDALAVDVVVDSTVRFRTLDEPAIEAYLARVHTLDKAGGYAIQEHPDLIIEGYEGSLTNIIGLPLSETNQILTHAGWAADFSVSGTSL
ncbi:MAG: Septum formation protein Maf [Verrucomicrobiota bacterium]